MVFVHRNILRWKWRIRTSKLCRLLLWLSRRDVLLWSRHLRSSQILQMLIMEDFNLCMPRSRVQTYKYHKYPIWFPCFSALLVMPKYAQIFTSLMEKGSCVDTKYTLTILIPSFFHLNHFEFIDLPMSKLLLTTCGFGLQFFFVV